MARVMCERGRAEQQEDQDNPYHDRLPFSQRLRFCAVAPFFGSMFTGLRRGPEPAPLFVLRGVHTGAHPAPNRERRNGSGSKREQHAEFWAFAVAYRAVHQLIVWI